MTTRSEKAQEEVRQFKHNIHQIIALILGAIILLFFIIAAIIIFEDKYKYGYEVADTIVEKSSMMMVSLFHMMNMLITSS